MFLDAEFLDSDSVGNPEKGHNYIYIISMEILLIICDNELKCNSQDPVANLGKYLHSDSTTTIV